MVDNRMVELYTSDAFFRQVWQKQKINHISCGKHGGAECVSVCFYVVVVHEVLPLYLCFVVVFILRFKIALKVRRFQSHSLINELFTTPKLGFTKKK